MWFFLKLIINDANLIFSEFHIKEIKKGSDPHSRRNSVSSAVAHGHFAEQTTFTRLSLSSASPTRSSAVRWPPMLVTSAFPTTGSPSLVRSPAARCWQPRFRMAIRPTAAAGSSSVAPILTKLQRDCATPLPVLRHEGRPGRRVRRRAEDDPQLCWQFAERVGC